MTASETVGFPTKSAQPDDYEAFESKLRRSKWWSEVSALDRHALKRLWDQRDELEATLRKLLERYATTETQVSMRLRNRRG